MSEQKCFFCPEYMDSKLFICDGFGDLSWNVSHQFKPAFKYQLIITPKKHRREIVELTKKEKGDLLFIIKSLLLFIKPKNYVIFWFKGVGRTQEHFHIHIVFQIPDGFKNLPKPDQFVSHKSEYQLPMLLFDDVADQNYTTLWTKKGIGLYLRKKGDNLFERSEKERLGEYSYEQACKWADELRRGFKKTLQ